MAARVDPSARPIPSLLRSSPHLRSARHDGPAAVGFALTARGAFGIAGRVDRHAHGKSAPGRSLVLAHGALTILQRELSMILDDLAAPSVLAPLAVGPSTPGLTAAVTDAGGLAEGIQLGAGERDARLVHRGAHRPHLTLLGSIQ